MDKVAIILFAIFSTSVANPWAPITGEDTPAIREKAIDEFHRLERELNEQYDKFRTDFLKYNETAMVVIAGVKKLYHDDINEILTMGDKELIISHLPVYSDCRMIYEKLEVDASSVKESVNACTSNWLARNTKYLHELNNNWAMIQRNINGEKVRATDIGKEWLGGVEVQSDDVKVIHSIISTTSSACELIRTNANKVLKKTSWAMDSEIKLGLDKCLEESGFNGRRQHLSQWVENIKTCVSTNIKMHGPKQYS